MYTVVVAALELNKKLFNTYTLKTHQTTPDSAALTSMFFVADKAAEEFGSRPDAVRVVYIHEGESVDIELGNEYLDLRTALEEMPDEIDAVFANLREELREAQEDE